MFLQSKYIWWKKTDGVVAQEVKNDIGNGVVVENILFFVTFQNLILLICHLFCPYHISMAHMSVFPVHLHFYYSWFKIRGHLSCNQVICSHLNWKRRRRLSSAGYANITLLVVAVMVVVVIVMVVVVVVVIVVLYSV